MSSVSRAASALIWGGGIGIDLGWFGWRGEGARRVRSTYIRTYSKRRRKLHEIVSAQVQLPQRHQARQKPRVVAAAVPPKRHQRVGGQVQGDEAPQGEESRRDPRQAVLAAEQRAEGRGPPAHVGREGLELVHAQVDLGRLHDLPRLVLPGPQVRRVPGVDRRGRHACQLEARQVIHPARPPRPQFGLHRLLVPHDGHGRRASSSGAVVQAAAAASRPLGPLGPLEAAGGRRPHQR